jgi:hypothetical protein
VRPAGLLKAGRSIQTKTHVTEQQYVILMENP